MRAFAEAYPNYEFVQQVAAQLPWGHAMVRLDQVKKQDEREWYMRQAIENGSSRMSSFIKSRANSTGVRAKP